MTPHEQRPLLFLDVDGADLCICLPALMPASPGEQA